MGAEFATAVRRTPTTVHAATEAARHRAAGHWSEETVGAHVRRARAARPDAPALVTAATRLSWAQYDDAADRLAGQLVAAGLPRGARVAVLLPDGPTAHVAYLAAERAGLVVIGVAARSGEREVVHLLRLADADALLSHAEPRGLPLQPLLARLRAEGLPRLRSLVVPDLAAQAAPSPSTDAAAPPAGVTIDGAPAPADAPPAAPPDRQLHPDELFLLNSTSGTTGLPKCVVHSQQPWLLAGRLAIANGELTGDDVILCAVPTPYGFGLWSGHVAPALLGAPTVLLERFDVEQMLDLIERERVTMLAAVTTQLAMVLGAAAGRDLSSLRVVFTGGEAVPPQRAAAFERLAGAKVLQFYGANETGIVSGTTVRDDDRQRLHTAGRPAPGVELRLGDPAAGEAAAVRGPGLSGGYLADPQANAALLDADGWMRTGDLLALDGDGCLRVVGRASDIVIRGGKNISAPAVEAEVASDPRIAQAAVVAMPDELFGERVCLYAAPAPGVAAAELTLASVTAHLTARGLTREWLPEHLVVLERLPMSAGGKVAKTELREDIRRRLAAGERPETGRARGGGAA